MSALDESIKRTNENLEALEFMSKNGLDSKLISRIVINSVKIVELLRGVVEKEIGNRKYN